MCYGCQRHSAPLISVPLAQAGNVLAGETRAKVQLLLLQYQYVMAFYISAFEDFRSHVVAMVLL